MSNYNILLRDLILYESGGLELLRRVLKNYNIIYLSNMEHQNCLIIIFYNIWEEFFILKN